MKFLNVFILLNTTRLIYIYICWLWSSKNKDFTLTKCMTQGILDDKLICDFSMLWNKLIISTFHSKNFERSIINYEYWRYKYIYNLLVYIDEYILLVYINYMLGKLGTTEPQFSGIQFTSPNYFPLYAVKTESNNDQI